MFRRAIKPEVFKRSRMISDPISSMDSSPVADGAAALVLVASKRAREFTDSPVRVASSAGSTDSVALHDRRVSLFLAATRRTTRKAYHQATSSGHVLLTISGRCVEHVQPALNRPVQGAMAAKVFVSVFVRLGNSFQSPLFSSKP